MHFKIFTIPHTAFAAGILVEQLTKLGHTAELTPVISRLDTATYIIYGAHTLKHFPQNFIIYQTEISTSHHFTPMYLQILSLAKAVWDYSPVNTQIYKTRVRNLSIVSPGIKISPPVSGGAALGVVKAVGKPPAKSGILFYGWLASSPRRQQLLAQIQRKVPVQVITNITGQQMWQQLQKAHTVLNLHFYNESPFESFRIHEALSHGCQVVSEPGLPDDPMYKNCVSFASGAPALVKKLQASLNIPFAHNLQALDNLQQLKDALAKLNLYAPAHKI